MLGKRGGGSRTVRETEERKIVCEYNPSTLGVIHETGHFLQLMYNNKKSKKCLTQEQQVMIFFLE